MALETGDFIDDLVLANPVSNTDLVRQGAGHLRQIKKSVRQSFAGSEGAVLVSGLDAGTANAVVLNPAPALTEYSNRMLILWRQTVANTGAATLKISALPVIDLVSVSGAALTSGDLVVGHVYVAIYDSASGDARLMAVTKNYIDQLSFASALPNQAGNDGKLVTTSAGAALWKSHEELNIPRKVKASDVASAGTVDLGATVGDLVHITGTTTITAITLASGAERDIVFDGVLTLTHNATTLILPGNANITTAAGDRARFRGDGAGNVRCMQYTRADGTSLVNGTPVGNLVLLSRQTPSGVATVDFTGLMDATYDEYELHGVSVIPSASAAVRIRTSSNNGVSFDAGGTSYKYAGVKNSSTAASSPGFSSTGAAYIDMSDGVAVTAATGKGGANFRVRLSRLAVTQFTQLRWELSLIETTDDVLRTLGVAITTNTTAVNALRVFLSSGNIASGTLTLYGVKK